MGYAYLASPYTSVLRSEREKRYVAACKAAAKLMQSGLAIFAPIAHSHPIEQHFAEPEGFDFWMAQDLPILQGADKLIVLKLPGWKKSRGVAREIQEAQEIGMPIEYIEP
jgi:hypothetical protein